MKPEKELQPLFLKAKAAHKKAYAPYSKFHVGAALILSNGKSYSGCNIENASYGGTVCAERVAVWKAYSENDSKVKIRAVVVFTSQDSPWPPCGFCRQVLSEFSDKKTEVYLANSKGIAKKFLLKNLLPHAFEPEMLKS